MNNRKSKKQIVSSESDSESEDQNLKIAESYIEASEMYLEAVK